MADYLVQEDGSSKILLEDGTGALLLDGVGFGVPFIGSVSAVYALSVQPSSRIETFTTSSSWTCPPGITTVDVEIWAAGGGGVYSGGPDAGGGGGGGAYAANNAVPVTPGAVYAITVGAAGGGGTSAAGDNPGHDGGDSSFTGDSATQVLAKGGKGGSGQTGGAGGVAASSIGTVKFDGGSAGNGSTGGGGGGGGAGASALGAGSNGTAGAGSGSAAGGIGVGGAGSGGAGGAGGAAGHDAIAPGGGGGGDGEIAGAAAGSGAGGQIRLSWALTLDAIPSNTIVYPPTLAGQFALPFISSITTVYGPTVVHLEIDVPFIASATRVFGIFSLFNPAATFAGPGNGGETFQVRLAPNGTSQTATLAANVTATGTLLELTGDGALPAGNPFCLTIDAEIVYLVQIAAGSYRIRGRGGGNTTAAAHLAGATVTWTDSYDMAIAVEDDIAHDFTADIASSGSFTYPGWLQCFDSSQGYLAGARYPMHVESVLGVFDAGAGSTGTSRCDGAQPNAVCTPIGVSDACPAALSNYARIETDVLIGDVAVVRYTNREAAALDLGPRATSLLSWFGLKGVDNAGVDVTFTDPNRIVIDTTGGEGTFTASVNGEWDNPLGPGIGPSTGLPTSHDVPYTTVTLPGTDRDFTVSVEKGWPIGVLAVRQGNRRIPYWQSWDWHDFGYVYPGFGTDCTFAQNVINRNGVSGSEPEVALPGPQNISGPDAVWDDGSYEFGTAWCVAIFAGPYLVAGPSIGGTPGLAGGAGAAVFVPTVDFSGGVGSPSVTVPSAPLVEGGSGGGIGGVTASRFDAALV